MTNSINNGASKNSSEDFPKNTITIQGITIPFDVEDISALSAQQILEDINKVRTALGMKKIRSNSRLAKSITHGSDSAVIREEILKEIELLLSVQNAKVGINEEVTEADMAKDAYHIQLEQAASTRTLGKSEGKKASSKKDKKRKQPRTEAHRRRPALSFAAQGSENAEIHDPLLDLRFPTITNLGKSTPDLLVYETVAAIEKFCQYHNLQEIAPDYYSEDEYVDVENLPNLLLKIRDHSGKEIDNLYNQWLHIVNPVTA